MSELALLLGFVVAASMLTITPGVDTAIVLREAVVQGRRPAAMASLGIVSGCLVWGASVALGLGALLRASELAYTAVKLVGAGYLLWLGATLLLKPRTAFSLGTDDGASRSAADAFRRGFLTNLLNPKVGVFYVSFLPQFVPAGASVAVHTFLLACLHVALTLLWFAALIAATAPLAGFLRRPAAVQALDRLTGCVFVAFGIRLATSSGR